MQILVVDDEPTERELLVDVLQREGFEVEAAGDGSAALESIARNPPDLVVLDIILPGVNGLDVLSEIRRSGSLPVILLSGKGEVTDRVLGLGLGADDYLVKPCFPAELVARVRSVLRRPRNGPSSNQLVYGELVIDLGAREVVVSGERVALTNREFEVLSYLAQSPRRAVSRAELLRKVWASSPQWQSPSTVTEHIRRLRQKIEVDPSTPRWVVTVPGFGYRFQP
jgi:DNA-binding response OmpR family regulator